MPVLWTCASGIEWGLHLLWTRLTLRFIASFYLTLGPQDFQSIVQPLYKVRSVGATGLIPSKEQLRICIPFAIPRICRTVLPWNVLESQGSVASAKSCTRDICLQFYLSQEPRCTNKGICVSEFIQPYRRTKWQYFQDNRWKWRYHVNWSKPDS